MKSVRLHGTGDLQIHEEPVPVAGVGEKLIRIRSVGVCGSDLHWFAEGSIGDAKLDHPLVLGHEFAGDGHGKQDGALREYGSYPTRCLFPIPDSLSYTDGAMLEPLGVAIHTVDLGHLKAGMSVGVFGCGPIGLLIIQMAKLSGAANIIATDKLPHRVEAAKGFGASQVYLSGDSDRLSEIRAATLGRGVDVSFEAAGDQDAVDDAFAAVRPGGKVILAGIPDDDRTSFSASVARRKGLTIKLVRRMKHTYPRAIELVSNGLVDVRSIVTHRFSLEQAEKAFRVAERREGLKIIIDI